MPVLIFTANDTAPTLAMTCSSDGVGVSLGNASVVVHVLRPDSSVIDRAGVVVDADAGLVELVWQAGDLSGAGTYEVEVQVTYADGRVQTFGRPAFVVRREIA